jgi:predicted ester cyclase
VALKAAGLLSKRRLGTRRLFRVRSAGLVPANNNRVDVERISIYRLHDGKVVEHRAVMDVMGLMQQLGAIPSGGLPPA